MIFLICGIQKNYTKEFINKTEIELQIYETILWFPGKRGGEINWETGIAIYTSPSDFQLPATLGPISIHITRSQYQPPAKCVSYPTHPINLDPLSVPLLWNSPYFIFWLLKNKLSERLSSPAIFGLTQSCVLYLLMSPNTLSSLDRSFSYSKNGYAQTTSVHSSLLSPLSALKIPSQL